MPILLSPPLKVVFTMPETKQRIRNLQLYCTREAQLKMKHPNHLINSMFKLAGKTTYPQITGSLRLKDINDASHHL